MRNIRYSEMKKKTFLDRIQYHHRRYGDKELNAFGSLFRVVYQLVNTEEVLI